MILQWEDCLLLFIVYCFRIHPSDSRNHHLRNQDEDDEEEEEVDGCQWRHRAIEAQLRYSPGKGATSELACLVFSLPLLRVHTSNALLLLSSAVHLHKHACILAITLPLPLPLPPTPPLAHSDHGLGAAKEMPQFSLLLADCSSTSPALLWSSLLP